MEYLEQVHLFATKWIEKFKNQKISYIELVDHYLADDCQALGFQMDCGHAFSEKYGDAASSIRVGGADEKLDKAEAARRK